MSRIRLRLCHTVSTVRFRVLAVRTAKGRAVEKLHEFGMRLTVAEIELLIDVGAVAVKHARIAGAKVGERP